VTGVSLPGRRAADSSCDLFRVRKKPVQMEWLALTVSPSKWQCRGIREAPLVSAVDRWAMTQACPKRDHPRHMSAYRPANASAIRQG
jgi:hypothetical protein